MAVSSRWIGMLPVLLVGCLRFESPLAVERAVLVLPAGGAPAALYFTAHNRGHNLVTITGVEIPGGPATTLQTVTAHRMPAASAAQGTMAIMSPVDAVPLEAGATVRFAPGGYTVALPSVPFTWWEGDSVAIAVVSAGAFRRDAWARVVTYRQLDSALGLADATVAPLDSAAMVAEGEALYRGNGCAQCHGRLGDGQGPLAATLEPPPRNFRRADAYRNGGDVESIAQTLATGIPGGGAMPLYAHLTRSERLALARYVRALSTVSSASAPATPASIKESP